MMNPPKPALIQTRRSQRYLGDNLHSSLQDLRPSDAAMVSGIYGMLRQWFQIVKICVQEHQALRLLHHVKSADFISTFMNFTDRIRNLNDPTGHLEGERASRLRKNLHDVRGGAFAGLCMQVELLWMLNTEIGRPDVLRTFYLVRDHLKIMRNCFVDLDTERGEMDRTMNMHSTDLIREKWVDYRSEGKAVRCVDHVSANIACCCLEFSTVDRIIYNLMNNAFQYGSGDFVDFSIGVDDSRHPKNLVVTIENQVDLDHFEVLKTRFDANWNALFLGGFTTGGSGDGMRICSECVCNAYGYTSVEEALQDGLIGALGNAPRFRTWFCWPLLADTPPGGL